MAHAWMRGVPDTFDRAIVPAGRRAPDVALARAQHDDYRRRLVDAGFEVTMIPADDLYPDCVFIEDTAVIVRETAVATIPGAVERRGEVEAVVRVLGETYQLASLEAPALVDGGDIMIMDETIYVGLSRRTNEAGADQLAAIASDVGYTTIPVPVSDVLHLKSGVLPVDEQTVVVTQGTVDESVFSRLRVVYEHEDERNRFSALPLTDRVLVTSSAPLTARRLEALGVAVDPIDVSEILAANGGLTCISIIG